MKFTMRMNEKFSNGIEGASHYEPCNFTHKNNFLVLLNLVQTISVQKQLKYEGEKRNVNRKSDFINVHKFNRPGEKKKKSALNAGYMN